MSVEDFTLIKPELLRPLFDMPIISGEHLIQLVVKLLHFLIYPYDLSTQEARDTYVKQCSKHGIVIDLEMGAVKDFFADNGVGLECIEAIREKVFFQLVEKAKLVQSPRDAKTFGNSIPINPRYFEDANGNAMPIFELKAKGVGKNTMTQAAIFMIRLLGFLKNPNGDFTNSFEGLFVGCVDNKVQIIESAGYTGRDGSLAPDVCYGSLIGDKYAQCPIPGDVYYRVDGKPVEFYGAFGHGYSIASHVVERKMYGAASGYFGDPVEIEDILSNPKTKAPCTDAHSAISNLLLKVLCAWA